MASRSFAAASPEGRLERLRGPDSLSKLRSNRPDGWRVVTHSVEVLSALGRDHGGHGEIAYFEATAMIAARFWQLVLASWTWDEVEALAEWADEAESARGW